MGCRNRALFALLAATLSLGLITRRRRAKAIAQVKMTQPPKLSAFGKEEAEALQCGLRSAN